MNEDQTLTTRDWVSLNTLFSIAVGTAVRVINQGSYTIRVAESATEPTVNDFGYQLLPLTNDYPAYGVLDFDAGSAEIWVRATDNPAVIAAFEL